MVAAANSIADYLRAIALNPAYHDILAILKGARNGLVYGAKVRFPHALVMTVLFHKTPWNQRAQFVYRATKQHALNLCKFVSIYKTALLLQKWLNGGKERSADTFFAGLLGGWIVFGERNAVNEQIVLYVVSRVVSTLLPRDSPSAPRTTTGASLPISNHVPTVSPPYAPGTRENLAPPPGYPYPRSLHPNKRAFELYAALTWGAVMWLFNNKRERLQGGMVNSMQYLYLDSEVWNSLRNLVWHNK